MLQRLFCRGQHGQLVRDFPRSALLAPEAQQAVHSLPLLHDLRPRTGELELCLLVERLLLHQLQIADVARRMLAAPQLGGGLLCIEHQLADLRGRLCGLEAHECPANFSREVQHRTAHAGLRGIELRGRDALAHGQGEETEEVLRDGELRVRRSRTRREAHSRAEGRVAQQSGLDEVRLSDSELLVGGHEPLVAQQGNLDGALRRQRVAQQVADMGLHLGVRRLAFIPMQWFASALLDELRHLVEARAGRSGRATSDGEGRDRESGQLHGARFTVMHVIVLHAGIVFVPHAAVFFLLHVSVVAVLHRLVTHLHPASRGRTLERRRRRRVGPEHGGRRDFRRFRRVRIGRVAARRERRRKRDASEHGHARQRQRQGGWLHVAVPCG